MVISALLILMIGGSFALEGCKRNDAGTPPTSRVFQVPPGFPQPVYDFQSNPQSEEGFRLGRQLFYEGRLSRDGQHSCASCHQPEAAFTTLDHDRSHGYAHSHTLRNAPGLFNLAWYPFYNQDGGEKNLHKLIEKHIRHPFEMAEDLTTVVRKLDADPFYPSLFKAAYGSEGITEARLLDALSQFVINMVSADSKYDRVKRGQAVFSAEEQAGYLVFQNKCTSCHTEPLFTDFSFRNIGLPVDPLLNDLGRKMVTGRSEDSLKFRVPSLRNLEFTSYYTHDGRFSLPRHVIRHYRFGVNQSPTLDPQLTNGIPLTDEEEDNLVYFLRTLSDSVFLNNPKYRP